MAIEYIIALNNPNALKKHAIIDIDDLHLDKRNPRFSSSTIIGNKREVKETEIIEYLLQFGHVAELAESINRNQGLYDEEWISCYVNDKDEIIVLEGNRRVAACKILKNPSLVSDRIKANIPLPSVNREKTLPNICRLKAIIYENEADAQNYIAAKHTKPEVMKWETVEQCNYYYEQFINGIQPVQIANRVGDDVKKVREKIRQFGLFKKVFLVVNAQHPTVLIEDINILPLVTKFLPPLISSEGKIGLSLSYDEESLTYLAMPEKEDVFNKILLKIGEAFFVRPKLRGGDSEERATTDIYRISTDEIKTKKKVEKMIVDNVRIPSLYNLILEYRQKDNFKDQGTSSIKQSEKEGKETNSGKDKNAGDSSDRKISEFFADINYSHINKKDYLGLVLVCEEIQKISIYNSGSAYKQFPISASFLLRSLIEQVLSERLRQLSRYEEMVKILKDGSKRSPELGAIIGVYLKDYQNKNYMLFWNDGNLGREFNKCFSGYGTKDQLDTIIHNPHLIQPDHNFLNSFSKQGLKTVIQGFLDHF